MRGQAEAEGQTRYSGVRGCVMIVKPMLVVLIMATLGPAIGVAIFFLKQTF